jgi:hypothetical protein
VFCDTYLEANKIHVFLFSCSFFSSISAGPPDSPAQPKQGTAKKSFKPVSGESLAAAAEQQQLPPGPTLDKLAGQAAVKRQIETVESGSLAAGIKKQRRDSTDDIGKTTAVK